MPLRLRPYQPGDEATARAVHEAMRSEDFPFLLLYEPSMSWSDFLSTLERERRGIDLAEDLVRATQLAAIVDGQLVGRASVRFALTPYLAAYGGHIGYAVAPSQRRRGYAREILRQALVVIRAEGVERVLVTCDDGNVASARVIEGNGGVLESVVVSDDGRTMLRRYWFE